MKGSFDMIFDDVEKQKKIVELFGNQEKEEQERADKCNEHFRSINTQGTPANFLSQHKDFLVQNLLLIPLSNYEKIATVEEDEHKQKTMIKQYIKGLIIKITNIGKIGVENGEVSSKFKPESELTKDQIVTS